VRGADGEGLIYQQKRSVGEVMLALTTMWDKSRVKTSKTERKTFYNLLVYILVS